MKVLYFAWLRSKIGVVAEDVTPPPEVTDIMGLIDWLRGRGPKYAEALANAAVVKVAVNQEYVSYDHPVSLGDEVALFPPVTGG